MSKHFAPEPLWWPRARELAMPPYTLPAAAIGRLLKKDHTAVIYALRDEWREKRKAYQRSKKRPTRPPHTPAQHRRHMLVQRARRVAQRTSQHVDEILISWGEKPRRAR